MLESKVVTASLEPSNSYLTIFASFFEVLYNLTLSVLTLLTECMQINDINLFFIKPVQRFLGDITLFSKLQVLIALYNNRIITICFMILPVFNQLKIC